MKGHAFGEPMRDVERTIKRFGEKLKIRSAADPYFIYVIGPINEQAAPYHDTQQRKIDPMEPADGEGMLIDYFFHCELVGDWGTQQPIKYMNFPAGM